MAILIKGCKIPNTCIDCPCLHKTISDKYYCTITGTDMDRNRLSQNKRNEDCPMQEVLEPGNLLPLKYAIGDYYFVWAGR